MEINYLENTQDEIEDWAATELQNTRTRYNGNFIIAGTFDNIGQNVTDLIRQKGHLAIHLTVRHADSINEATWCQVLNAMPNLQSITVVSLRTFRGHNNQQGPAAVVEPKLHLTKLELINSTSELLQTLMNPICTLTTFSVIIGYTNTNQFVAPNPVSLVSFLRSQSALQTLNIDVTREAENLQLFTTNAAVSFPFTLQHLTLKVCGYQGQPNEDNMLDFLTRQSASLLSFKIGHNGQAAFNITFNMPQLQHLILYRLPPVSQNIQLAPAAQNLNITQLQVIIRTTMDQDRRRFDPATAMNSDNLFRLINSMPNLIKFYAPNAWPSVTIEQLVQLLPHLQDITARHIRTTLQLPHLTQINIYNDFNLRELIDNGSTLISEVRIGNAGQLFFSSFTTTGGQNFPNVTKVYIYKSQQNIDQQLLQQIIEVCPNIRVLNIDEEYLTPEAKQFMKAKSSEVGMCFGMLRATHICDLV